MKRLLMTVLLPFMMFQVCYAEVTCKEIESYRDVLECADARSLEVQEALLEVQKANLQVQASGQWKNPELSADILQNKFGSGRESEMNLSLGVPIEFGSKTASRVDTAQANVSMTEARLLQARSSVRGQMVLKLHRLRQALHEREIINEATQTFSKLVEQYLKRSNLAPEQQLSLSVFQLSKGEYELKKIELSEEILELQSYLKSVVGVRVQQQHLPQSPKVWPQIETKENVEASPQQNLLKAQVEAANAELTLARSEAWPTLTVGPSYRLQTEKEESTHFWGIRLSLPLPLFNVNQHGIAAAAAGVQLSEAKRRLENQRQLAKVEALVETYKQSVKILSASLSHQEIEKRHSEVEKLFIKGVVPSALVIEAHRASVEVEKARHARELSALQALLEVYASQGILLEASL